MVADARRVTVSGPWSWVLGTPAVLWQAGTVASIVLLVAVPLEETRLLDYLLGLPAVLAGLSRRRYWIVGTGVALGVMRTAASVADHRGADVALLLVGTLAYASVGLMVEALATQVAQAGNTLSGALAAVVKALDYRDSYTLRHAELAAELARQTAIELGLDGALVRDVHVAAILHDVGKIGIPDRILNKPSSLDPDEYEIIKKHPEIGYEIVRCIDGTDSIATAILHHHERWDGAGYPRGLKGESIPVAARIIAVTDAFEAMVDDRVYRRGIGRDRAFGELARCAGTQFDPRVVRAFLKVATGQPRRNPSQRLAQRA